MDGGGYLRERVRALQWKGDVVLNAVSLKQGRGLISDLRDMWRDR